ncbi:hypothetical protein K439DRAFT_1620911 [Ramaria rubella]|nr:hypothetical protein K439DRAFT_1620911 [Ramaria rubella]
MADSRTPLAPAHAHPLQTIHGETWSMIKAEPFPEAVVPMLMEGMSNEEGMKSVRRCFNLSVEDTQDTCKSLPRIHPRVLDPLTEPSGFRFGNVRLRPLDTLSEPSGFMFRGRAIAPGGYYDMGGVWRAGWIPSEAQAVIDQGYETMLATAGLRK